MSFSTVLFVINNLINRVLSLLIGKSIIRFGEKKGLSLEYSCLIFVFLGYAVGESRMMARFFISWITSFSISPLQSGPVFKK